MRNIRHILFFTVFFFAFLITNPLFATTKGIRVISKQGKNLYLYKDYHAIVIGISDYEHWPRLPNAVKDAKDVAIKLKEMGFYVRLVVNPASSELKFTLNDIARRLGIEKNRALLFYFAGHGETTRLADGSQLGYIVPKDCPLQSLDPLGFDSKAVSIKDIEMLALRVKCIHMLMLFDSCFSGSLFSMTRAAPTDISEKSANPVRQLITAGAADETVPDRSVFKVCLLQALDGYADYNKDSYITGSELGMYLQTKVINYSRGAQHPQYGKINNPLLDKGDFIFALNVDRKAESKDPEKEKPQLVYIPKSATVAKISLRKKPMTILNAMKITNMLIKYSFFDISRNILGSFENHFVDNNDGTVRDKATGLMWQKSGSSRPLDNRSAKEYIKRLNRQRFSGYSDWRMPTVEELASLLNKSRINGVHMAPVFDSKQIRCWTDDRSTEKPRNYSGVWIISFKRGEISQAYWYSNPTNPGYVGSSNRNYMNYVKAVLSVR